MSQILRLEATKSGSRTASAPPMIYEATPFPRLRFELPLFETPICAGFPSPAEGYAQRPIDLNELLITNPPATFLLRVDGDSMRAEGVDGEESISHGDLLVVNRAVEARDGHIVVACLDGEFTVKRLCRRGRRVWLQPANSKYPLIPVSKERDFAIWGVVTSKISQFKV